MQNSSIVNKINRPKLQILTVIVGLLLTNISYGQRLRFRDFPVDSIIISSHSGSYHFSKKKATKTRSDFYTISFDGLVNQYVANCKTVQVETSSDPDTAIENTKYLSKGSSVLSGNIKGLLTAISSRHSESSFEDFGFSKQEFLSLTDERHIRKVAKKHNSQGYFKNRYSSKETNEIIFNGCQSIDTFRLFVRSEFDTTRYSMVTDYWDEMTVKIITAGEVFIFEAHYPNTFKQPWYDHSDTSKLFIPILNLNINKYLVAILPDKFYKRNTIELQSLTDSYITWYLERRGIPLGYIN